jgi:putative ABC transport system substrate-binding protein
MSSVSKCCLLVFFLSLSWVGHAFAEDALVVVVSKEFDGAYLEAAQALQSELKRRGVAEKDLQRLTLSELAVAPKLSPQLFLALGAEAANFLAKNDDKTPVLNALIPQSSFERVLSQSGRRPSSGYSALYLNQPLTRQIELIKLALPQARRIGLLLGAVSHTTQQAALADVLKSRGLTLVSRTVAPEETVFAALRFILDESNVLLALPDPQIYNSNSIQNILLTSFRAQIPMVAFSPAYVRAGALLAVYSTPAQIGKQAGELVYEVLQGRPLPAPQYPRDFSIGVNEQVARSLGLVLESEALAEQLLRQEKRR